MRVRAAVRRLLLVPLACAAGAAAQAPALSGMSPTPTPPTASSGDWEAPTTPAPTPVPKLSRPAGPAVDATGKGQSLADVVRLSKEARKGQPPRKSLGTITNENLRKGGAATTPAPGKVAAKGNSGAVRSTEPTPAPTYDVIRDDTGRSEADWRAYAAHTRAVAGDAERRVRELDTKAKQLENDFYAQSDGYRRDGVIKPAWDKARDDLAKARADLEAARKAVDDLQDEARKANANPGWLR